MDLSYKATLLNRLLDATRECQTQYSTNGQLMTERSSNVSCVCRQFEEVLSHGLKRKQVSSSIYTIQSVTGLQLLDQNHPEPVFWHLVQKHLSKHELDRFSNLYHITTDTGKGRAWLRSALNEHSLERTLQMILGDVNTLKSYYIPEAFLMDEEKSNLLPEIAGGLRSIMFSIKIDDSALNNSLQSSTSRPDRSSSPLLGNVISIPSLSQVSNLLGAEVGMEEFPEAALQMSSSAPSGGAKMPKKDKKKAKKTKIIKFSHSGQQLPVEVIPKKENIRSSSDLKTASYPFDDNLTFDESSSNKVSENQADTSHNFTSSAIEVPKDFNVIPNLVNHIASIDTDDVPSVSSFDSKLLNVSMEDVVEPKSSAALPSDVTEPDVASLRLSDDDDSTDIGVTDSNFMLGLRLDAGSEVSSLDNGSLASMDVAASNLPDVDYYQLEKSSSIDRKTQTALTLDKNSSFSVYEVASESPRNISEKTSNDSEASNDLQKALVVLLQRKDELVEETKVLKDLLDTERARSDELYEENERLKEQLEEFKHSNSIDNKRQLQENEVLRSQLKRYVGAVQALQQGKASGEAILSEQTSDTQDQKHAGGVDEKVYEQKLIDVTEMHGELMEFTEALHTRFLSAMALIHKMHDELVALRGPLPTDNVIKAIEADKQAINLATLPSLPKALINVWVPSAFMQGSGPESHHVYQIYTCLGDDEWNVYRRYSDFYALHNSLSKPFPEVKKFGFPRKKNIGNRNSKIVEERRKAFQGYLRMVLHTLIQKNGRLSADPTKKTLVHILPFFSDSDTQCRVIVGKHK